MVRYLKNFRFTTLLVGFCFVSANLFASSLQEASDTLHNILKHLLQKKEFSQEIQKKVQKRESCLQEKKNHFWFPFAKLQNPEAEKANFHYKEAIESLKKISMKLQEWEIDYGEDIETPSNREEMQKELSSLLNSVKTNIESAIEINPNHAGYYIVLGVNEMMWGLIQDARANFEKSLQIDPNFSDPENSLFPGDADLLIEICNTLLEQSPNI
jgi:tetratricopeptide (TPR) repeat protein